MNLGKSRFNDFTTFDIIRCSRWVTGGGFDVSFCGSPAY